MISTFIFFVKVGLGAGQEALLTYVVKSDDKYSAENEYLRMLEHEYPMTRFPDRKYLKTVSFDDKAPDNKIFGMFLNGHREGEVE